MFGRSSLGGESNLSEERPGGEWRARFQYQKNFNEVPVDPQSLGRGTLIRFLRVCLGRSLHILSGVWALLAGTDQSKNNLSET